MPDLSFGSWLKRRRRGLGLTQSELGRQAGYAGETVRKVEAGVLRPSRQMVERLADALEISPEDRTAFIRFARTDLDGDSTLPPLLASLPPPRSGPRNQTIDPDDLELQLDTPATADPTAPLEAPEPGDSPFQGLRYFAEADAPMFFGREALVHKLITRLTVPAGPQRQASTHFLAVVGASGSGKSSILRAGLIPALRRLAEHPGAQAAEARPCFEPIHVLSPTARPLEALAASLTREPSSIVATTTLMDDLACDARALLLYARRLYYASEAPPPAPYHAHSRLLLVVDQFEELFTLCHNEAERKAFIDNLTAASDPEAEAPITIVIALRADFYPHCAAYVGLRQALADQQEYIGPMSAAELRQAVELPAQMGGWTLAPGLTDFILSDVSDEPGALPLLSQALLATWQRRHGRTLTLESYAAAGRVQGAIANSAEAVYQSLTPVEQAIARRVFLRLTALGDDTQDTRRRVAQPELMTVSPDGDGAQTNVILGVLKTLSDARLLTQDDYGVEVAHEALIREWPTLRKWLTEDREGIRLHRHLTESAQEWQALERDAGELYRGQRLEQALVWAADHAEDLNTLETGFLSASQALAEQASAELETRRQSELRAAQALAETQRQRAEDQTLAASRLRTRNRIITAVGLVAVLTAVVAGLFGLQSSRNEALVLAHDATSDAASTQSSAQQTEAVRESYLAPVNQLAAQAASILNQNLPLALLLAAEAERGADSYVARDTLLSVVSYSPHLLGFLVGQSGSVTSLAYSPDGTLLAAVSRDGALRVWDVATHRPVDAPVSRPAFFARSAAFSPDGKFLAVGEQSGLVYLWDVVAGRWGGQPLGATSPRHTAGVNSLAFSPDGRLLATGSDDETIRFWNVATGQPVGAALTGHSDSVTSVAFSPNGKLLASGGLDGTVWLWDVASHQPVGDLYGDFPYQQGAVAGLAFGTDGTLAISLGGNGRVIEQWDLSTRPPGIVGRLTGHTDEVTSLAFSPGGALMASASADHTVRLWDTATRKLNSLLIGHDDQVLAVTFGPDGKSLASGSADHTIALWQVASRLVGSTSQDWLASACEMAGRNLTRAEWGQYLADQPYRKTCDQWPDGP